jgi:hypothetical protein
VFTLYARDVPFSFFLVISCVCVCVVCQIVKYVPVLWLCQRADDVRRSSERGTVTTGRRDGGVFIGPCHANRHWLVVTRRSVALIIIQALL